MQSNKPIAIVDGVRTPFAKAFGAFIDVSAVELGRTALEAVLLRCGLSANDIDEVVFGNVAGPADSANIARVIALKAGVPNDRIAHTVNRNCASGMESIFAGCSRIREGRASTIVAGGTESMSQIPMLLSHEAAKLWLRLARSKSMLDRLRTIASMRPKHFKPVPGIELGLTDPVSGLNMGETAEVLAKEFPITRDQQDAFALESHKKASEAQERCFMSGEIASVTLPTGEAVERDNGPRKNQTLEQLGRLRPLFGREGTITAGNSCPLTDGAAALVLSDPDKLDRFSRPPLGYITAYSIAGCDPRRMGLGPVYATAKLFAKTGLSFTDFDNIEINEAFAAQVLACERAFGSKRFAENELSRSSAVGELPMDRVNVHGGAIALGHPVGTSGTRIVLTLLRTLKAKGKQRGLATLCVGGGQGVAMVVET
ncbi:putative acetyl-CoA acyltransferase [Novipirellula aureliae]|uniref:Putative acetyl-CoA acyltransferase n=1 Tax=Novipirellula aureliae TaxID=2527966 RepID=A0A5C6E298_9BACT|nr:thiolase family protein [Novipirellula aureliae]TWU43773.1 putative acetyl-CoA acyltransferase [Novipirellula aureliae]